MLGLSAEAEDIKGSPNAQKLPFLPTCRKQAKWQVFPDRASDKILLRGCALNGPHHQGFRYADSSGKPGTFGIGVHGIHNQSAAGGAGNPHHGQWSTHGGRKRQTRTFFRVHEDGDGFRVGCGDSTDLGDGAGATALSDQREHEKRSGVPGGEVKELPQRQRVRGTGVYRAGGGFLGHAFSGRPDWSGAASCAGRNTYACGGEWSAGGCACASSSNESRTDGGKQRSELDCGETACAGTFEFEACAPCEGQFLRCSASD